MRTQVMKLAGVQQPTHLRHDEQQLHKELPRAPQSVAHHLTVTDHRCSLEPPLARHVVKHAGGISSGHQWQQESALNVARASLVWMSRWATF